MITDPTKRFTDKVDQYVKYRPGYPADGIDFLQNEGNLSAGSTIADIGSGTGIFTELLLNRGYKVYGVEPNDAMQQAAILQLGNNKNFIPIDGTAEGTTLRANSIQLIVCAQAFHWFKEEKTRTEFNRILTDNGHVALIWNNRSADVDDFSLAYENLLKGHSVDYNKVNHRNVNDINFKAFFNSGNYKTVKYPNKQVFDEEGFLGRAFSSSYVPSGDTGEGKKFAEILKMMFAKYNQNGKVTFYYQTEVYFGRV